MLSISCPDNGARWLIGSSLKFIVGSVFVNGKMAVSLMSSIYRTHSYMKWQYGGVRHGAIGGNSRDFAFGVLALG